MSEAVEKLEQQDPASAMVASAMGAQATLREKIEEQRHQLREAAGSRTKTRKSARTRQRIIDATAELIAERGSVDVQMSEVAARCHMSKGALYYYFRDRSQIIDAVNDEIGDAILGTLEGASSQVDTAVGALREVCTAFADALSKNASGFSALAGDLVRRGYESLDGVESRYSRLVRLAEGLVDRGKAEGSVRPDVDTSVAANGIVGMFLFATLSYRDRNQSIDPDRFADQMMGIVMAGVGAPCDHDADSPAR